MEEKEQAVEQTAKSKKKGGKIAIIIAIVVVLLIVILVVGIIAAVAIGAVAFSAKTVDLNNYIDIETEGYDGYGYASYSFDKDAFVDDCMGKIQFTGKLERAIEQGKEEELEDLLYDYGYFYTDSRVNTDPAWFIAEVLEDNITLSASEGLSNGDEVVFSWNLDEFYDCFASEDGEKALAKYFHVKFNGEDMTETISGLMSVPTFDPFEGVEVLFSGISPAGSVVISNIPENGVSYYIDGEMNNLKNGDSVKVIADCGSIESYIQMYNQSPSETEKTYEVTGLPEYITSFSEIPMDAYNEMKQQAEDVIDSSCSAEQTYTLVGNYFLTAKTTENEKINQLVYIYKVHCDTSVTDFWKKKYACSVDYYYCVSWSDFYKDNDEFMYNLYEYEKTDDNLYIESGHDFVDGLPMTIDRDGYGTFDEAYQSFVSSQSENYNIEEIVTE